MNKAITISDVAREAQVSISTVSRVLNRQHTGDPKLRERVLKIAEKFDYKPNAAARSLAGGGEASRSMGFVMHSLISLGTYFGDVLRGAEEEAQTQGYGLYFSTANENLGVLSTGSEPKGLSGKAVGGVIYTGVLPDDFYQEVHEAGIPLVLINTYSPGEIDDCVMCDNFSSSYRAIKWLVELGHRRIACIACETGNISTDERVMGYRQALLDAGIEFDSALFPRAEDFLPQHGYRAMERMTQLSSRPTAVFGVVDELAVGAIQCAREVGLRVPEDLSVIGMNDLEMAQICDPPLTTVRIFREEMGRVAVKRLVELIQNPQQRARRIDVLCELVKRASCAPVS
ncbi:MAG: LacI family DNA-binding transcriptional regulator [Gemmatimonadetes bacterium]|nr:LacI family DNA-binding transcriptional regulator [Gemmatimonadota bacterium]